MSTVGIAWGTSVAAARQRNKEAKRLEKVKISRWDQLNAIWDTAHRRHQTDTTVLALMHRHANKLGLVQLSVRQIAEKANIAPSTAQRAMQRLLDAGIVKSLERGSFRRATRYQIVFTAVVKPPS